MLYKLLNKLFDRQYIAVRVLFENIICRVEETPSQDVIYWQHGEPKKLIKPDDVIWLTCKPEHFYKFRVASLEAIKEKAKAKRKK